MVELTIELGAALALGLIIGAAAAWLARGTAAVREMETAEGNWQRKLEQAVNKARALDDQTTSLKLNLEETQKIALKNKHTAVSAGTELESMRERAQTLAKELSATRAERDSYSEKLTQNQKFVIAAKARLNELTDEFEKSRRFYKSQLANAVDQRRELERKIEDLKSEQESLTTLLASSKAEHDAVNRMLISARKRVENIDSLEQKSIELEADNADLRHKLDKSERRIDALQRDIAEFDDLKAQNRELARCLESMENSRKQYEADARRYREQYEHSEKQSETLRMKLGDIEKSLTEMQQAHEDAQRVEPVPRIGTEPPPDGKGDDLTQIVGIGKVFEAMLHRLGIYYFRQIATFGPTELARVNAELKEFKGRIEHDDWIGQARELHFRKYGASTKLADAS
jgi:predicted flap endonuclease-1-like 5' DNA nuclease